jgi:hypothetical protein
LEELQVLEADPVALAVEGVVAGKRLSGKRPRIWTGPVVVGCVGLEELHWVPVDVLPDPRLLECPWRLLEEPARVAW